MTPADLRARLLAAGCTIGTPTNDGPVWQSRRARVRAAYVLSQMNPATTMLAGTTELDATAITVAGFLAMVIRLAGSVEAISDKPRQVWILGPHAAWLARGDLGNLERMRRTLVEAEGVQQDLRDLL